MRNQGGVRRAAMGALVAAALMAGAGLASAAPYRFPVDGPSRLPEGRSRLVNDRSWGIGKPRATLASIWRFPWEEVRIFRYPWRLVPKGD